MRKACLIEGDKVFEADVIEGVTMTNDIESEVAMDESTVDSRVETFSTLVLETSAVAPMCQCETGETEGGGDKTKVEADAYKGEIAKAVAMGEMTEDGIPRILVR